MNEALKLSHINVSIGKKQILCDVSLAVNKGEICAILGANGSGKSTLLKAILGHLAYSGGMALNGECADKLSIKERARIVSYVPQSHHINFPYNVLEVVLMGRFSHSALMYHSGDKQKAIESLEMLGIAHLSVQTYSRLSGGQKQLVLIARSLAQDTPIIVLDEPVSALDISHSFRLLEILSQLTDKSIIITSHHPEQCFIAHKIAMIKDGRLLHYGTPKETLCESHIKQLYGIDTQSVVLPNGGVYFCAKK
ncbi:ABC transporter ATP-binding protein [uncultured Helicobacter sp.]|uniref:ABC transporter ATP-binding protein n=2 Tax=uncultured Helicobacter sp. TaxID=175537 RepID=UPI002619AABD|nr:ABC transporter ATP-binding protein [uncultured Helicobacter sp.]